MVVSVVDAHLRPEVIVSPTNLKLSTAGTLILRVMLGGAHPEVHSIYQATINR